MHVRILLRQHALHRVQDLRDGVQGLPRPRGRGHVPARHRLRGRHVGAARRGGRGHRGGHGRCHGRVRLPPVARVQPLRRPRLHARVPHRRHAQGRPRARVARRAQVHRLRVLHHGLPLSRPLHRPAPEEELEVRRLPRAAGRGAGPRVRARPAPCGRSNAGCRQSWRHVIRAPVRSILPLPPEDATWPNLFILPSPAAALAAQVGGHIANHQEIQV